MKKRILALALAGTTAFSMFGGLNVFAAIDADGKYEAYSFGTTNPSTLFTSVSTTDALDAALQKVVISATEAVSTGNVYIYDYNYTAAELTALKNAISAAQTVVDTDDTAAVATAAGNVQTALDNIVDGGLISGVVLANDTTTRLNTFNALKTADGVLDAAAGLGLLADFTADLNGLPSTIGAAVDAVGSGYANSELISLLNDYNYFDELYSISAGVESGWMGKYEQEIEKASALVESDYTAVNWTKVEGYIITAETLADEGSYKDAYEYLVTYVTGSGADVVSPKTADKSELKAALKALYTNSLNSFPTIYPLDNSGNNKPVYLASDYAEGTGYTDAFTTFAIKTTYVDSNGDEAVGASVYTSVVATYKNAKAAQSTVDAAVEKLEDAVAALELTNTAASWELVRLDELVTKANAIIPTDYKTNTSTWKKFDSVLAQAEAVLEKATPGAREVDAAYTALLNYFDGTNPLDSIKVSYATAKADLKKLLIEAKKMEKETEGKTAAQILALKSAITAGDSTVANGALLSSFETAIANLEDAMAGYVQAQGWYKNDAGKWMYGTGEAYLANGWNKLGGTWYYFNADGTAKQGEWMQEDGTWYWFTSNCNAARGWAKVNGEWYFFNDGCKMMTGWVKVAGSWYYLAPSGKMVTGWVEVDGKWYYLSKEANAVGQMLANTTVDGYKLGADGAWVK